MKPRVLMGAVSQRLTGAGAGGVGVRAQVEEELVEAGHLSEGTLEPVVRRGRHVHGVAVLRGERPVVEGEADRAVVRPVPAAQVRADAGERHVGVRRLGDAQVRGDGGVRAGGPVHDLAVAVRAPPAQVLRRAGVPVDERVREGDVVVHVEGQDLAGGVQRQRVFPVAGPMRQRLDQVVRLLGVLDVGLLVGHAHVPLGVFPGVVVLFRADLLQVLAQFGDERRGDSFHVRADDVVGGAPGRVVLHAHEPDLVALGPSCVEVAQPVQDVRALACGPGAARPAQERVHVSFAGTDVLVDLQAECPVVLPGDGPEPHALHQVAQGAVLERGHLPYAVGGLSQSHDGGVPYGSA